MVVVAAAVVERPLKRLKLCLRSFVEVVICVHYVGCCAMSESVFGRLQVMHGL